jgi:hypothetical protein
MKIMEFNRPESASFLVRKAKSAAAVRNNACGENLTPTTLGEAIHEGTDMAR